MNQVVLIKGDRITEAGLVETIKIPAGAEIVDLSRATGRTAGSPRRRRTEQI